MALKDFLFGSGGKTKQLPTLNKQQQSALSQILGAISPQQFNLGQSPLYGAGANFLQQLLSGGEEATKQFEAPYLRQFQEQIIPGLAERFSGLGAGAQKSSAFQQALGSAGADLSERLASLRGQMQMGSLGQALGYAQAPGQMGLNLASLGLGTRGFENLYQQPQHGLFGGALQGLAGGFGQSFGRSLGGKIF